MVAGVWEAHRRGGVQFPLRCCRPDVCAHGPVHPIQASLRTDLMTVLTDGQVFVFSFLSSVFPRQSNAVYIMSGQSCRQCI